ncbi:MAG TPA: glycerate kinase [Dissulfurispiraceae bacterium]|nr:glycerate kinase [Dissulfurispiraceae bacterium]
MKDIAVDIFRAGLAAVNPYDAVKAHILRSADAYRQEKCTRLFVLAVGKAAFPMMRAAADMIGDEIGHGIVLTKYDHAEAGILPASVEIHEAGHPVPDESGLSATRQIMGLLNTVDENTMVLCLLSGGASALLVAPHEIVSLEEKQRVTRMLLKAGATIQELNAVRKHLSRVKGGRLAELAFPAKVVALILSDVVGDALDVIASGPTAPDSSTFSTALEVVRRYGLESNLPKTVLHVLNEGVFGFYAETPKAGSPIFRRVENIIVGSNRLAAEAARARAEALGFDSVILGTEFEGEASVLGRHLVQTARASQRDMIDAHGRRRCIIAGGETTVKVRGNGLGGRNTEMALVVAQELAGGAGITFLSAGTDGTDGPTDAAGAVADGSTVRRAAAAGLDASAYLADNDSYHFFKRLDDLVVTGPTGTNVMDLQVVLIEP